MIRAYDRKAYTGITAGVLTNVGSRIVGGVAMADPKSPDLALLCLSLVGTLVGLALTVWGCSWYARAKGQHWVWGFLGMLSLFGFIILMFVPDNYKEVASIPSELKNEELVPKHEQMSGARFLCFGCGAPLRSSVESSSQSGY